LAELRRLRAFVDAFCLESRLGERIAHSLTLVVEELLTNLVAYGYDPGAPAGVATVSLHHEGGAVVLSFEDDGRPFDPTTRPVYDLEGTLEDRPVGGLGLHLIRTMMDEVRYARVGDRNCLILAKRIQ
jgi:anti-sigma regulatory factor (Ser/Thr protein kinase)